MSNIAMASNSICTRSPFEQTHPNMEYVFVNNCIIEWYFDFIMEELVSVIVPVYNIEAYLPHCLECIEAQTYKNLEIVLVDDGSTDGSGRICDEFAAKDPRARVIHQPNTGCWAASNAGQDAATGEYLWFPDGDDYFHKDIIRLMYEAINTVGKDGNKDTSNNI